MKKRLHSREKSWNSLHLKRASLEESTLELKNPGRGWYQIHTFVIGEETDWEELKWCLDEKDSLALLILDIAGYRDRDLDENALEHMGKLLTFFEDYGYDIILRVTYDHEGKAMEKEPFSFQQVLKHLEQIGRLLQVYGKGVFLFQGMLIGNWGEMHTSRFMADEKLQELGKVLRFWKRSETYLAVRTPRQWRLLHENPIAQAFGEDMGLYDDGIFGNENHLGTYGSLPREKAGWCEAWAAEDELGFIHEICDKVPNGGEAVWVGEYAHELNPQKIVEDLKRMQISYLNRVYDERILNSWKRREYRENGVWKGKSLYDYISAHMGYRLLIQKVKKAKKGPGVWEIVIKNIGFAACYQEGEILLEIQDARGNKQVEILESHLKGWKSGESRCYVHKLIAGEEKIFLAARRKRDKRTIFFANNLNEEGKVEIDRIH